MRAIGAVCVFLAFGVAATSLAHAFSTVDENPSSFTVEDARTLSPEALGKRLIGNRVGRVVAAHRREYESGGKTPQEVKLFLTPKMPWPYIRNVCSVDVVTVEYNWFDFDGSRNEDSLKVHRIQAQSRFLPSEMPVGDEPIDYEKIEASCAKRTDVDRAFRAPDAGDAQWLLAMHKEYSRNNGTGFSFPFECSDFEDRSCAKAAIAMRTLELENSSETIEIECEMPRGSDQVNYCYRLTFPHRDSEHPEWILKLDGGMSNGSAPVRIRRAVLEHVRRPIVMH